MATTKAIVSIALAYSGYGVWSLVWGHLAGVATWSSLLWIRSAWRPRLTLPRDLVRPMLTYGRGIVAVNLLAAVTHRVDLLIVGRTLGEAALGFYQMAYKIPEMSITIIIWVAARVLFPTFSRLQSQPRELNRAYLSALRYLSLVTLPAAAALVVLARPLVLTLFGSQWEPVVPILRALAVYTGIRSLGSHAGDVLKAAGRPGQLAMLGVLKAAMVVPAVWLASSYGTSAVASAMASVVGVNVLLNLYLIHRLTGLGTGEIVAALRASVLATAAAAMGWVGWIQMAGDGAGSFRLLAAIGFGATIYLATLRLLDPGLYREVLSVLVQRGASANVAPAATATHPPDSSADAMGPA